MISRRQLLAVPLLASRAAFAQVPRLRLTGVELIPVRASSRTVWLFVRVRTDAGLAGLGEASDAFGFANTTAADAARMRTELQTFFGLIEGRSPYDVEYYRQRGWPAAQKGLVPATAFSAIEQAMWDLAGQALGVPTYLLLGGKVHDSLPVYANINRAASPRTPDGFAAAARRAVADGFRAVKAAPFDGFPPPGSPAPAIEAATEAGIAAAVAIRAAVGADVDVMIDCHGFLDVDRASRVANRLEPQRLRWFEEPAAHEDVVSALAVKARIRQPTAAGELLFGLAGFEPLIERRPYDVIMPDVKHCGGLLEFTRIAAAAAIKGIAVSPHNPSGPVGTAASLHACAGTPNANFLELQYGEAAWRPDVLTPRERFVNGRIEVADRPGFGIALDEATLRSRPLPL